MQIKLCRKICIRIISCQFPSLCGALNIQLYSWSNKYVSVVDIMFHVSLTQVSVLLSHFLFLYKINKNVLSLYSNQFKPQAKEKEEKKKKKIVSGMYTGDHTDIIYIYVLNE